MATDTKIVKYTLCPACLSQMKFERLNLDGNGATDGLLECVQCHMSLPVYNSIVINTSNHMTRSMLQRFGQLYPHCRIELALEPSEYGDFVEEREQGRAKGFLIGKILLMIVYMVIFVCVYITSLWPGYSRTRSRPPVKRIIDQLAEAFYYVPEMAVFKLIEMLTVSSQIPGNDLGTVLDIGGSNGYFIGALLAGRQYEELINIDICPVVTDIYDFQLAEDAARCSLKDASIDLALSVCVIEHIPEAEGILSGICEKIKPGGKFIFTTPCYDYAMSLAGYRILDLFSHSMAEKYKDRDMANCFHVSLFPTDVMHAKLEGAGFSNVESFEFLPDKYLILYEILNWPTKLASHWHFWYLLRGAGNRYGWFKSGLKTMLIRILMMVASEMEEPGCETCTHVMYVCEK